MLAYVSYILVFPASTDPSQQHPAHRLGLVATALSHKWIIFADWFIKNPLVGHMHRTVLEPLFNLVERSRLRSMDLG